MTLVVSGTDIDGSGTVDDEFQGRFWKGKLKATAYHGLGHDTVTVVLTAHHQVVQDRPHPGDKPDGELQEVASVHISAKGDAGSRKDRKRTVSRHPEAHNDIYVATLTGEATNPFGTNPITSWNLTVKAVHTNLDSEFLAQGPGSGDDEIASVSLTPTLNQETGSLVVALHADDKLRGL